MYNVDMKPKLKPVNELDKFCKSFDLWLEIEKPFPTLDGLILKVVDSEGNVVQERAMGGIEEIEETATGILGEVSKEY